MKRFLSAILILVLLTSGCSNVQHNQVQNVLPLPDSIKNIEFKDHLNISVAFWDIQDMVAGEKEDPLLSYIENTFNVTFEPISVSWSDYKEKYQIMSATGSLPDMFASLTISSTENTYSSSLNNLILSNSVRSLPEDLSNYPNIKDVIDKCGNIQINGLNYVIPRISFQDKILGSSDAAMLVRKDWMKKLGLSQPESLEEFINLVCAFANDDPDGNGKNDTIGYNVNNRVALGKWVMLGIAPECNVYNWIETDQGYTPSFITDNFKKVVTAYRTLYEKGGLDPDFYTKKSSDAVNDFASGKLGTLEYKSSPSSIMELKSLWEMYQDTPFENSVDVLPIFPADDGNYYSNSSRIFWSETLFSNNLEDEKMERILYIYNYLLSKQGLELVKFGIEGVDYEKKNGEYHCLIDTGNQSLLTVLMKKYPSLALFANLAAWGGTWDDFEDNELNNLRYGAYAMELARKDILWNQKNTIQVDRPYDFMLLPKETTDYFNTETVIDDFTRVIIGKEDPIIMWDHIVAGYYANGLKGYIDRQNEKFKEYSDK
ncbi:MAG: sugar transporter substrate-binding protein [Herbinix sp.]|nr:sugar transporter substrate-binding protein [Herbinix sp.]